jgi:NADPH-dependent curcumin reductase CurA
MSKTTFRRLRFPILIGGGIIAAGILVYFSNGHINQQKTQGAIGQRDVYRDGEVKASDVAATPGEAPVAVNAILQSKEFKALANNSDFQATINSSDFNALLRTGVLSQVLAASHRNFSSQDLIVTLQQGLSNASASRASQDALSRLATNESFNNLLRNPQFLTLASNPNLSVMLTVGALQSSSAQAAVQNATANASANLGKK